MHISHQVHSPHGLFTMRQMLPALTDTGEILCDTAHVSVSHLPADHCFRRFKVLCGTFHYTVIVVIINDLALRQDEGSRSVRGILKQPHRPLEQVFLRTLSARLGRAFLYLRGTGWLSTELLNMLGCCAYDNNQLPRYVLL